MNPVLQAQTETDTKDDKYTYTDTINMKPCTSTPAQGDMQALQQVSQVSFIGIQQTC